MARYEITSADGRKRIVDGDSGEILPDGATLRVPMMFRDAALTPVQKAIADAATHFDAAGGGGRPGFAFDYAAAARVKEQAYQDAKREMSDAWRTPPVAQSAPAAAAPPVKVEDARPAIPVTDADFARLRQIRDESYRAMVAEMESAWRGPAR